MSNPANKPELIVNGKRLDGRGLDELRPIKITSSVLKNAAGSSFIEWGNNKIMAAVNGPREALPKHTQDPDKAVIKCRYSMSPFSSIEEHGSSRPSRRSQEISKVIREVFENVAMLDYFPGGEIEIFVEVLQSDGGTRAAGITAASVAMADAGIPMRDLPYALSVGRVGDTLITDMNKIEDNYSDADIPMAVCPRNDEILLLQMDGTLKRGEFGQVFEKIKNAGKVISKLQTDALKEPYINIMKKYGGL
jgi:exosome complex component RRP41